MHTLQKVLAALVVFAASSAASAAPTLSFTAAFQGASPGRVDLIVRAEGLASTGLAAVHFDLHFDASAVALVSATAGGFFTDNAALGSLWSDSLSTGLQEGDAVQSTVTDATTTPDVLGFDLLELLGLGSTIDGQLLRLVFDIGKASSALFTTNDVILLDAQGTPTFQAGQGIRVGQGGGTVPEPSTLAMALLALTMVIRRRVPALTRRTAS